MKAGTVSSFGLVVVFNLALFMGAMTSHAISYSFSDALEPGGVVLANGATMSGELFAIGRGVASVHHGENTGMNPAEVGGPYDGTVFDPTADTDPSPTLVTRLAAEPRWSVDQGYALDHKDAVGIYVNFSVPTLLQDFYILDLDGLKESGDNGNTEWAASFAFNGDVMILPLITLAATTYLKVSDQDTSGNWQDLVDAHIQVASDSRDEVPSKITMAVNVNTVDDDQAMDPDLPFTQALFDYNTPVTDLFILWGIQRDVNVNWEYPQQSSGITGFSMPSTSVPDAGAAVALLGLALLPLAGLRRKLARR